MPIGSRSLEQASRLSFSQLLKSEFKKKGRSIEEFATTLDVRPKTLEAWINEVAEPDQMQIKSIAVSLDIEVASLNAALIHSRTRNAVHAQTQPPTVPAQTNSVHFTIHDGLVTTIPTQEIGPDKNDYRKLTALQVPLLQASRKSQSELSKDNKPFATLLEAIENYLRELDKDVRNINYAMLYAYGLQLALSYDATEVLIEKGELPDFGIDALASTKGVLQLHGPFILSSSDGQDLVTDAERYERNPNEERQFQTDVQEFGEILLQRDDLIEEAAREVVLSITSQDDESGQFERRYLFKKGAAKNLVIVFSATAVIASTTYIPGVGPFIGAALGLLGGRALNNSKLLNELTEPISNAFDDLKDADFARLLNIPREQLDKMLEFVMNNQGILLRVGGSSREMGWFKDVLRWLDSNGDAAPSDIGSNESNHLQDDIRSEVVEFAPLSTAPKALSALSYIAFERSHGHSVSRSEGEEKFGKGTIQTLFTLGLLKNGVTSVETEADGLSKTQHRTLLKNRAAATQTMTLVRQELLKNHDISSVELAKLVGKLLNRPWSKGSLQRHGGALKTWARWIDPHVIDPTKSTYQYDPSEFDHPSTSRGRKKRKINPAIIGQVSALVREGYSDPAISEKLSISVRHVKQSVSADDAVVRKQVGVKRRKQTKPRAGQTSRWNEFKSIPLAERIALADLWYGDGHADHDLRPRFELAGAPKGFSRRQFDYLFGPRNGSRKPDWYNVDS